MRLFAEGGLNLGGIILIFILILGAIAILISLLGVFLYYTIKGKPYTRKELWSNTFLVALILCIISGTVCGLIIN